MRPFNDKIESKSVLTRLFIISLMLIKFLISFLVILAILAYIFSGFGLIFLFAEIVDYGEIRVLGWIVISINISVLLGLILTTLKEQ